MRWNVEDGSDPESRVFIPAEDFRALRLAWSALEKNGSAKEG